MEKVIVFALLLVNVQLVVATCSSETAGACSSGYNACVMAAGTSNDQLCYCYGAYSTCLLNNDCINSTSYQSLVSDCEASGCTAQQCSSEVFAPVDAPSYVPTTLTPVTQPCDSIPCVDNYYACSNGSADNFCRCYGEYLACLYYLGCLTRSDYQNAIQSCEQNGCSAQQCSDGPITPVTAPSYVPTTAPVTQPGCDATSCLNTYYNCTNSNPDGFCSCYGDYLACIYYAGCITESDYQNAIQSCEQNGCSSQQCSAGAPVSNSPVDAPSYAPTTNAPVTQPGCDATTCIDNYYACTNGSSVNFCPCYGEYLSCLFYQGCYTVSEYLNATRACEQYGCSSQQCTGGAAPPVEAPSYAPTTSTPVTQPNCDSTTCVNNYYACSNSSTEGFCPCYGEYLYCIYFMGCINQSDYQSSIQSCEQLGCTAQQCLDQSVPISNSPVSTPVASPFNGPVSGCSSGQATFCANEYQSCVQEAGVDVNSICNCYGPYFMCLYEVECLTVSQYQSLVQTCAQSGCTLQQCAWNSTVIAPFGVTPTSEPTSHIPYSVPVSAPFAPPTTVICLQPWELVLIVVGSVLAGVGLAAIVGVIIYLSRRSSAKKTTTKYAKLQTY